LAAAVRADRDRQTGFVLVVGEFSGWRVRVLKRVSDWIRCGGRQAGITDAPDVGAGGRLRDDAALSIEGLAERRVSGLQDRVRVREVVMVSRHETERSAGAREIVSALRERDRACAIADVGQLIAAVVLKRERATEAVSHARELVARVSQGVRIAAAIADAGQF